MKKLSKKEKRKIKKIYSEAGKTKIFKETAKKEETIIKKARKEGLSKKWMKLIYNLILIRFFKAESLTCKECSDFKTYFCEGGNFPDCFIEKAKIAKKQKITPTDLEDISDITFLWELSKLSAIIQGKAKEEGLSEKWIRCIPDLIFIHFFETKSLQCEDCLDFRSDVCEGGNFPNCFIEQAKEAEEHNLEPFDLIKILKV